MFATVVAKISANLELFYILIGFIIIAFCVSFIYLFVYSMEKRFGVSSTTINENLREIFLNNWQYLPIKWFEWLKWVLIIGAISIIGEDTPDILLQSIILISYIAIAMDSYHTIYKLFLSLFYINIDNSLKSLYNRLDELEEFIKSVDELKLLAGTVELYSKEARETIINAKVLVERVKEVKRNKQSLDKLTVDTRKW